ncbi:MAG: ATP-dependent 6-phosphofructokinase [Pirellulales bacterium]
MRIGVFCSGGDAPGMNACTRAVVRTAIGAGHEVVGIRRGYQGLLDEDFHRAADGRPLMSPRCVSNIIQRGGTILGSSRSEEFRTDAGQQKAAAILKKHDIAALVPIGGDGTFTGAIKLRRFWDGQVVGCPGTIDNDLCGTDFTIGFATAVATAVEAVDKLRDTAASHERMFLVEVMGRHNGCIAIYTALAGGAECACVPETPTDIAAMIERLRMLKDRGKRSIVIIVAEGDEAGGAVALNDKLKAAGCPFSSRTVTLGHVQRGGSPTPADRILATRLGANAVQAILDGKTGSMAGEIQGSVVMTPLEETIAAHHALPDDLVRLVDLMSI